MDNFGDNHQETLLAIMAFNEKAADVITASQILPEAAYSVQYKAFFIELKKFVDKYGKATGPSIFWDMLEQIKSRRPGYVEMYDTVYDSICHTWEHGGILAEWTFKHARTYGRVVRTKRACDEAQKCFITHNEEECDRAEKILSDSLIETNSIQDLGINTHDVGGFTKFLDEKKATFYESSVRDFNKYSIGLCQGRSLCIAGKFGSGKSFGLMDYGVSSCFKGGAVVVHFSLEMPEAECAERFVTKQLQYGKRTEELQTTRLLKDDHGRLIDFGIDRIKITGFDEPGAHDNIRRKMKAWRMHPKYIIKSFPSGQMTPEMMRGFLHSLYAREGIRPDVVLCDYHGLMACEDATHKRQISESNFIKCRGYAQELGYAYGTAVQFNRSGAKSGNAVGTDVAEDISVMFTSDTALMYNQTDAEKKLGISRLTAEKARGDKGGFTVVMSQQFGSGDWCYDSAMMSDSYTKRMEEATGVSSDLH